MTQRELIRDLGREFGERLWNDEELAADLHGNLPADIPEGDVLALVGDLFPTSDHTPNAQAAWLKQQLAPFIYADLEVERRKRHSS